MFDSKPKYHESNETDSNQHYALPGIDKVDRLQIYCRGYVAAKAVQ